ncbi:DEAD/DEAH box helicase [Geomonas sp. RF6]|uniref:DEAD/DEAH box helicase n=1 Tax=Geomonas sp. RF6 TaxID=2897342 RepID=UPI001E3AF418|nr:DEAD/DEAH box helicase [Geomonas sp. RF6]UFS71018.1 DEAD/DEAH box helicase [Geomonas sp. RF6]
MDFKSFNLHPQIQTGVEELGYVAPTPIQLQAIPTVMAGQDVMGLAQTGTGKTAAFGLPMLHRLMQGERGVLRALVVAPTRELAEQINDALNAMGKHTRLKSITVYGGVNINTQIKRLKEGPEIVVACPGRLLDHISQGTVNLSKVEMLVLDEADQMFDMGFLPDVRKILRVLPTSRQNLLFSATMPDDIKRLAHEILVKPTTVQVSRIAPAMTVTHALYPVPQHLKTPLLFELLRHTDTESVLIFTKTKYRAKRIGEQLEKSGYKATSLQGNLSQNRRQAALDGFRDGTYQIMVATDIAARGIDVSLISHVINYDIPDTPEAYTHRIGRTGRAAKTGDAFTMVTAEDEPMVRSIERVLGSKLARRKIDGFDYTVPAPTKDTEFARPPREPRGPGKQKPKTEAGQGGAAAGQRPAGHHPRGAAHGQRPAGSSPRPAGSGQRPAGKSSRPAGGGQRPAGSGARAAAHGHQQHASRNVASGGGKKASN